jgi:hypothetical protein
VPQQSGLLRASFALSSLESGYRVELLEWSVDLNETVEFVQPPDEAGIASWRTMISFDRAQG